MRVRYALFFLLPVLLLFSSCNKIKQDQPDNTEIFNAYIQAHSDGFIGSSDPVIILLKQGLSNYSPGDLLPDDLVEVSPKVSGKIFLSEPNRIEFIPDSPLENGKEYAVNFKISKLISLPDEAGEFEFSVSVIPLEFTVLQGSLVHSQDGLGQYRYEGKIQCSDQMDAKTLGSLFSINDNHDNLQIKVENLNPRLISYQISGIQQKEEEYSISLKWNGRKDGIDEKGELLIEVPGSNEFTILSVTAEQGNNQLIRVVLSDAPDPSQELKGLIYLEGTDNYSLETHEGEVLLYPGQRLEGEWTLHVDAALKSQKGIALNERQTYFLVMSPLPPEVEFLGQGYILPDAGGLFLPFKTVSLRGVDLYVYKIYANNVQQFLQQNSPESNYNLSGTLKYVGRPVYKKTIRLDQDPSKDLSQWNSWSVDLSALVKEDPHALYHVEFRIRPNLAAVACNGELQAAGQPLELIPEEFDDETLEGYEDSRYYYEDLYPDEYDWRERDNPCHPSYYIPSRFVHTNVLATNLGVVAKSGNQKDFFIAVTDLLSAEPVSNASVQFYNFQQQQILAGMTDPDGMLEISLPEVPFLIEVAKDTQKAYLKVDDGSSLSLSNFDVAGEKVEGGIKGMIYGERGVWRPGDTLHLTFALFDKLETLPEDLPVILEVYNAHDQMVNKVTADKQLNGFYAFHIPTHPDDPTGDWRAEAKAGALHFTKRIKVESIRPNRIKMDLQFNREPLMAEDPNQVLDFSAEWLHGAPAAQLRAEVQLRLGEQKTTFKGYEQYVFNNPLKEYWPDEYTLFNDLLDGQGSQRIPLYLESTGSAPGMLKAIFTSRVYEQGGGFSTDVYTMPFSPYSRYVGVSVMGAEKPGTRLETDTSHLVRVVTLDATGQPVSSNNLLARVYKLQWSWWWSAEQNNLASYIGSEQEQLVYEKRIQTRDGKGSFDFRINYPDWGRYLVHVYDPESGHGAGQTLYIDWPAWASREGRANPAGANMLTFTADQEQYEPGDKALLTFPSMKNARALLTIESGEQVTDARWIKTDASETQVEIGITPEMAPNVYASITLVQAHEHEDNDLPIRQYGVLRLNVSDPESHLDPEIRLPDEIRPGEKYTVTVSEAKGKAMTYTLAIVDEGLLNLTRFKTPDPWTLFYAREALGVKTWDYFDNVIGAFGGRIESLLAIGGDEGEVRDDAKKANRFEPVVTYLGPFELKKNRKDRHEISMPDYIGEVRAMVVAGSDDAWGSSETSAKVVQPVMVLTSLPRRLATGDELDVPVSVFVMDEKIREATVNISLDGSLTAVGQVSQKLKVNGLGEYTLSFRIKVGTQPGIAKIIAGVISGKETATAETEIDIVNPNPYVYESSSYLLEKGEEAEIPIQYAGTPGTNSGTLSVSGLPSFSLRENLDYLINYPYGCLEQITSSAFAQLVAGDLADLDEEQVLEIDRHVRSALRKLIQFQLPSGAFSLWPNSSGANLWATSWAGHFMLAAQEKGYVVPSTLLNNWRKFQKGRVESYSRQSDYYGDSDLQQAYRLYTLALAGYPDFSAMNRLRESEGLRLQTAWRLAAAYALSGRSDAAEKLVQKYDRNQIQRDTHHQATFGSSLRDQAMILETMVLLEHRKEAFGVAKRILTDLRVSHYSTQTIAFSLLAIAQYAQGGDDDMLEFSVNTNGQKENLNTQKTTWTRQFTETESGQKVRISNRDENPLYVEFTAYGQSEEKQSMAADNGLKLQAQYTDMSGLQVDPADLPQGTTFLAEVRIINPVENGYVENLALSLVVPSGWEILSTRYAEQGTGLSESPFAYRDIRDDRVNTFFALSGGEEAVFSIRLNAAYKGSYFMPGILCEDMYTPGRMAISKGMRVEVR